jgi:hypothetical protein
MLAFTGCLITSALFLFPQVWVIHHHRAAALLIGFGIFAVGALLALRSTTDLRNGVESEHWPESQIKPFRRFARSPLFTAIGIALFVALVLLEFIFKGRLRGEFWACFLFLQTLSQVGLAFKRRPAAKQPAVQWNNLSPIRSDHWGER